MHAYGTLRSLQRKTTRGNVRHAVDEISHLCGAMDTACGKPVVIHLGAWEPQHPDNCQKCTVTLAAPVEGESA